MSFLHVYHEADSDQPLLSTHEGGRIASELAAHGIRFERWPIQADLAPETDQETVLAAYADDVARLCSESGFVTAEMIGLTPDHPDRQALRERFLDERRSGEDEAHLFVRGEGIFYLHLDERVYVVGCMTSDLISLPAGTAHWFDMGPAPDFTAIRLFTATEDGAVTMTGSPIASRFPRYEALSGEQAA